MKVAELTYEDWITGQKTYTTMPVKLGAGQTLAARTIVALKDGTDEYFALDLAANDGTQNAKYILVLAADTADGAKNAEVHDSGTFNPDLVAWPVGITDAQKAAAFAGSPISLKALA